MSDLGLCLWVVRHAFLSAHQAANAIQAHFSQDQQHKRSENIHDALRCLNAHRLTTAENMPSQARLDSIGELHGFLSRVQRFKFEGEEG